MGKPAEYSDSEVALSESNLKEAARMFVDKDEHPMAWAILQACAVNYEHITRGRRARERREEAARKRAARPSGPSSKV